MTALLDYQVASQSKALPTQADVQRWLDCVLASQNIDQHEITVRVVEPLESQHLNLTYRGKDAPTNVLSFPFEAPPGLDINLLGDLVICADVVEHEAQQQQKAPLDHWAHMVIHGTLHLLGYDHIEEQDADVMESLEVVLLSQLSIDDPYQDQ